MDYTEEIGILEMKRIQLNMLEALNAFCEKEQIKYSMGFGSLLGAVRHNGYIPWDDDVDIIMDRINYNRFLNSFQHPCYKVLTTGEDERYPYPFAKLVDTTTHMIEHMRYKYNDMGVYIDIFPVDFAGNRMTNKLVNILKTFHMIKVIPDKNRNLVKIIGLVLLRLLLYPLSVHMIAYLIDWLCDKPLKENDICAVLVWGHFEKATFLFPEIENTTNVKFENIKVSIINTYDSHLKNIYGDYMTLPPVDKRIAKHSYKVFKI